MVARSYAKCNRVQPEIRMLADVEPEILVSKIATQITEISTVTPAFSVSSNTVIRVWTCLD